MPDYTTYPTKEDVRNRLQSAGFWPSASGDQALALVQADINVKAAISEFEHRTGWEPFLADALATARPFSQTDYRGILDLESSLISLTGVSVNGSAYVSNQYRAMYNGTSSRNRIITSLQLYAVSTSSSYGYNPEIIITGRWGRVETVPADVWKAIHGAAAVETLSWINQEQDLGGWAREGFSETYDITGVITPKDVLGVGNKDFDAVVNQWKRVVV